MIFFLAAARPGTPDLDNLGEKKDGSHLRYTIDDFDLLKVLGKGSFGKVSRCHLSDHVFSGCHRWIPLKSESVLNPLVRLHATCCVTCLDSCLVNIVTCYNMPCVIPVIILLTHCTIQFGGFFSLHVLQKGF